MRNDIKTVGNDVLVTVVRRNGDVYVVKLCRKGFQILLDLGVTSICVDTASNGGTYARCRVDGRLEYVHRLVAGAELGDGLSVDHINVDTLDNRLVNLEVCSLAENSLRRHARHCKKICKGNVLGKDIVTTKHYSQYKTVEKRIMALYAKMHIEVDVLEMWEGGFNAFLDMEELFVGMGAGFYENKYNLIRLTTLAHELGHVYDLWENHDYDPTKYPPSYTAEIGGWYYAIEILEAAGFFERFDKEILINDMTRCLDNYKGYYRIKTEQHTRTVDSLVKKINDIVNRKDVA